MNGAAACPAIQPTPSGFCSRKAYSPPIQSAGAATPHRRILGSSSFCYKVMMSEPRHASWEWLNDEIAKTRSVTDRAREMNRKGPRLSLNPQRLR